MDLDSPEGGATENRQDRLVANDGASFDAARVSYFYSQGIVGIRGSLVAAIIVTISLWSSVSHLRVTLWLVCYIIACGIGEALSFAFRKSSLVDRRVIHWGRRFTVLSIIGGLLWGATPLFLFPTDSIFHQALLTFCIGGMSVGITISHSAVRAACLPFIIVVYVPLIGRYFYEGTETHVIMGVLLLVFMLYLLGAATRIHAAVNESLGLRFRNQGLIDILRREKTETERLNESLRSEVSERREVEEKLRASLEEKEVLLREIHHRVRNNLQVIYSLCSFQSSYIGKKTPEDIFSDIENRILSMALVHENLYQSRDFANIEFKQYVDDLVSHLLLSYGATDGRVTLEKTVDTMLLPLDVAIPCGLIINETICNCLKHAFPGGGEGLVRLSLARVDEGIELMIADNGVGLPQNIDFGRSQTLGVRLIGTLVKQLHGEMTVQRAGGTAFQIRFPMPISARVI